MSQAHSQGGPPETARLAPMDEAKIRDVTEPRRVFIDWDFCAHGIWWVLTKQEMEAPAPGGQWSGTAPQPEPERIEAWSDRLTNDLLDDLQEWNDAWDTDDPDVRLLQHRGRDLAVRVQEQLGTDGWEVLYKMEGQVHRVHPPASWPLTSWKQDLLGYRPRSGQ